MRDGPPAPLLGFIPARPNVPRTCLLSALLDCLHCLTYSPRIASHEASREEPTMQNQSKPAQTRRELYRQAPDHETARPPEHRYGGWLARKAEGLLPASDLTGHSAPVL